MHTTSNVTALGGAHAYTHKRVIAIHPSYMHAYKRGWLNGACMQTQMPWILTLYGQHGWPQILYMHDMPSGSILALYTIYSFVAAARTNVSSVL